MPLIRIQERPAGPDGPNAIVSFNNGPEYPITINNPFEEQQEQELEWYFEEHLEFPFTKKVRAQNAAASITTYGEELFKQVFGDPDIYAEYRDLLKAGLHDLQIEIAGSPKFHALHWESIKDPKLAQPLALQAAMVRKNLTASSITSIGASFSHHQPAHRHCSSLWQSRCWLSHHLPSLSRGAAPDAACLSRSKSCALAPTRP